MNYPTSAMFWVNSENIDIWDWYIDKLRYQPKEV